jgi:oligoribonuclease
MSKQVVPTHLVWIDLEMTGLDLTRDALLEIAVLVTSADLQEVVEGPSLVIYQPDHVLESMEPYVRELHTKSGLLTDVRAASTTVAQAQDAVVTFIKQHCQPQTAPLCGNSIWQDANFLRRDMPLVMQQLHYRMIDVSAFKVAIQTWYPENPYKQFEKKDGHRARVDIYESVEELRHYKKYFFIP